MTCTLILINAIVLSKSDSTVFTANPLKENRMYGSILWIRGWSGSPAVSHGSCCSANRPADPLYFCLHLSFNFPVHVSSYMSSYCPVTPIWLFLILTISNSLKPAYLFNFIITPLFLLFHIFSQFIILATDGLWDVLTSQQAVSFLHQVGHTNRF